MYAKLKSPYLLAALALLLATSLLLRSRSPAAVASAAPSAPAPLLSSLQGTDPDITAVRQPGAPVADEALLRLFDYYLATVGEQPLAQIIATLEHELDRRYPAAAAIEAKRLLKQYLAFKQALLALEQDGKLIGNDLAALQARLQAIRKLRAQFFSTTENQAMFGWQDAYDSDALARQQIQRDTKLSPSQRQQQLAELDRQLPPDILAARRAPVQYLALADSVTAARQRGASDAEVFKLRALNVGEAAAGRLAELDREEANWQRRIVTYRDALTAIKANTALDETGRNQAIDQLRKAGFSTEEQLRLTAYE